MRNSLKKICSLALIGATVFFSSTVYAQTEDEESSNAASMSTTNVAGYADNGAAVSSQVALVMDLANNQVLYSKNSNTVRPIASISKLLTALVIVRSKLSMDELIQIDDADVDRVKKSSSRLSVGTTLTRKEALWLALMSSENRAAHALGRTYPGGMDVFVREMNATARQIGMTRSRFVEPTGLSPMNVASPQDLVRLLKAVSNEPLIHQFSTSDEYQITTSNGREQKYRNTNRLVRNNKWSIGISKTGYIREAGDCLVMITKFEGKDTAVVLLNSDGRLTRFADAVRVRHLLQNDYPNLY